MAPPSTSQQRLFGAVLAAKRGKLKNPPPKIKKIGNNFSQKRQGVAKSLMGKADSKSGH